MCLEFPHLGCWLISPAISKLAWLLSLLELGQWAAREKLKLIFSFAMTIIRLEGGEKENRLQIVLLQGTSPKRMMNVVLVDLFDQSVDCCRLICNISRLEAACCYRLCISDSHTCLVSAFKCLPVSFADFMWQIWQAAEKQEEILTRFARALKLDWSLLFAMNAGRGPVNCKSRQCLSRSMGCINCKESLKSYLVAFQVVIDTRCWQMDILTARLIGTGALFKEDISILIKLLQPFNWYLWKLRAGWV